jgi:hypothetical protein
LYYFSISARCLFQAACQHVALRATCQQFSLSASHRSAPTRLALRETASEQRLRRAPSGDEPRYLADRLTSRLAKPGGVLTS